MKRSVLVLWAAMVVGGGIVAQATTAGAQVAGAQGVILERTTLQPGEWVVVTLVGWDSPLVTLSVCGNLAKRGSADCNLGASQAVPIAANQTATLTEFRVAAPPGTCPCVIRASSTTQGEVAVARVDLIGAAVGPVVDPRADAPVEVNVHTRASHPGFLAAVRSALGGPTRYRVTMGVRNRTEAALSNLSVTGSAGRGRTDELATFDVPAPEVLQPNQLWEHEALVTLPPPAVGRYAVRIVVSGAGPIVRAEVPVQRFPAALLAAAALMVADLAAIIVRRRARHRRRTTAHDGDPRPPMPGAGGATRPRPRPLPPRPRRRSRRAYPLGEAGAAPVGARAAGTRHPAR